MLKMLIGKFEAMFFKKRAKVETISNTQDFSEEEKDLFNLVRPYTMTSPERVKALSDAIKYIVINKIEGTFVECGVWKGGSVMAMLKVLLDLHQVNREIYLFDTFDGMSEPSDFDLDPNMEKAEEILKRESKDKSIVWAKAVIDEVKGNLKKLPYPEEKLHFIKGKVEDTLKINKPQAIALLRLDTDWYESTKVELEELYDQIVPGGVIIIDDYGHWQGAKKAVDEYISNNKVRILLNRIDYTGRIGIKLN